MYPPNFEYVKAGSIKEALNLLRKHENASLLAGGHSLIPSMKLRVSEPGMLIDIGRISDLEGVFVDRAGHVAVRALTTHATLAASTLVPKGLSEAAGMIGDPQVRNRGTVGGNVAHADPGSDLPTILMALNATFHVEGHGPDRKIPASDFFTGLFETALEEDEIITSVRMPEEGSGQGSAYEKLANPASGYAMVGAAASVRMDAGICMEASVAIGGLTHHAMRLPSVEAALVGQSLDDAVIAAAADTAAGNLGDDILGDIHASEDYRIAMAGVIVKRALGKAAARAQT